MLRTSPPLPILALPLNRKTFRGRFFFVHEYWFWTDEIVRRLGGLSTDRPLFVRMTDSDSAASEPVVDFALLSRATLERLASHYGLQRYRSCGSPDLTDAAIARAVSGAFAREAVEEEQVRQ